MPNSSPERAEQGSGSMTGDASIASLVGESHGIAAAMLYQRGTRTLGAEMRPASFDRSKRR